MGIKLRFRRKAKPGAHASAQPHKRNGMTRRRFLKLGAVAAVTGAAGIVERKVQETKRKVNAISKALEKEHLNPTAAKMEYRLGLNLKETASLQNVASRAFGKNPDSLKEENFKSIVYQIGLNRPKGKRPSYNEYLKKMNKAIEADKELLRPSGGLRGMLKDQKELISFRIALNTALLNDPNGYVLARKIWGNHSIMVV